MSDELMLWKGSWGFSSNIFDDRDRDFLEVEDMLVRLFRTVTELEGVQVLWAAIPYYYGCQITVGPDGRRHIREFGNARRLAKELIEQTNVRHPIVDTNLDEKENVLILTVEMPDITTQDLKVELEDGRFWSMPKKWEKIRQRSTNKFRIGSDAAKASYINGILELKINLKRAPKSSVK